MRQQLEAITAGFEGLKRLRQEVLETTRSVEQRVAILRKAHEDLVAASPQSACALGLDSLHFQVRLVSMELKSLREIVEGFPEIDLQEYDAQLLVYEERQRSHCLI